MPAPKEGGDSRPPLTAEQKKVAEQAIFTPGWEAKENGMHFKTVDRKEEWLGASGVQLMSENGVDGPSANENIPKGTVTFHAPSDDYRLIIVPGMRKLKQYGDPKANDGSAVDRLGGGDKKGQCR